MSEITGKIEFCVGTETYHTWYKIFGDLKSGVRPLVVLHGGPGLSHNYVLPFKDIYTRFNIPVVFYDQIGIGESSHPKDAVPPEFWTVDLFVNELENLLEKLGIKDNFDLAGHSWGGMLASHYASHKQPAGLHRLVLASSAPAMALWQESVRSLLAKLPDDLRETLEKHERDGTVHTPEYQQAMGAFYARHAIKIVPWPEDLLASFGCLQADPTVNMIMMGPTQFTIVGKLKDWSTVDRLHMIQCPTLLTHGVDDEAQDVCQAAFFQKIPKVRWVTFANCSHLAFYEDRDRYFEVVGNFLTDA